MTKEKIPFAERFNKFTGFVKNTLYLLGIVSIVCVAVYTTISKTFDIKIAELRNELNISINAVASDFDNRIVILENFVKNDIESLIIRQGNKIQNNREADMNEQDILDCLKLYPMLDNPSQQVVIYYQLIQNYYLENMK